MQQPLLSSLAETAKQEHAVIKQKQGTLNENRNPQNQKRFNMEYT